MSKLKIQSEDQPEDQPEGRQDEKNDTTSSEEVFCRVRSCRNILAPTVGLFQVPGKGTSRMVSVKGLLLGAVFSTLFGVGQV